MSLTLMCGLFCFAFTFDNNVIHWLWANNKPVEVILAIATFVLGTFWYKSYRKMKFESQK